MEHLIDHRVVTAGRGMVRITADEAVVTVQLISQEKRREPAVRAVGDEAARLKAQLDAIGYLQLTTSGTAVEVVRDQSSGQYAWNQGPIVGYQAQHVLTLTEGDFDRLERLLGALAGWEPPAGVDLQVSPAQWRLTFDAERDASAEACARAFADAKQRADAIAQAGGFELSKRPAFARQGSQIAPRGEEFMAPAIFAQRNLAAPAPPPVTLSAREFQIVAEVTAGWKIEKGQPP